MTANLKTLTREMAKFAAHVVKVRVEIDPDDPDEQRLFLAWLSGEISKNTAISLCRGWAGLIRKSLPERPDDWAAIVSVIAPLGRTMGVYCIGRTGHEDEWCEGDESDLADPQEWEGLYQRLFDYFVHMARVIRRDAGTTFFSMNGAATLRYPSRFIGLSS